MRPAEQGRRIAAGMADYRLSAKIISRGDGKSAVAAAAYRAAMRLHDERIGQTHDYRAKGGIAHSEIMLPDNTPSWMADRSQLWNAVEAIETRKNSQLSREIQLSLPHELTPDQRCDLVRAFVQEQFVDRGMIADVNLHAPSAKGDERNHHAHIMLTMRELTAEGFHAKKSTPTARAWNDQKTLLPVWRERWATIQNQTLERHGHEARVDHRSYEDQGIDRQPTQHLGSNAHDMELKGKRSRIGDENRQIANDNYLQAQWYAAEFKLEQEIDRRRTSFEKWADKRAKEIENAQALKDLDLTRKQERQHDALNVQLEQSYGVMKATIKAELKATDRRLESQGWGRKFLRDVFGQNRADKNARHQLQATLKDIQKREDEQRQALQRRHDLEQRKQAEQQQRRCDKADRAINTRRAQLRAKKYLARDERIQPDPSFQRPAESPSKSMAPKKAPEPPVAPSPPMKPIPPEIGRKGALARPWEDHERSNDNGRPWDSNRTAPNRGRHTPTPKRD